MFYLIPYLILKNGQSKTETASKYGGVFPIHEHCWALVRNIADASNAVLLLKFRRTCNETEHNINHYEFHRLTSLMSNNDIPGV